MFTKKYRDLQFTAWTAECCNYIERHAESQCDHVIAWLARLQQVVGEAGELNRPPAGHTENQTSLITIGLETQLREYEERISSILPLNRETILLSLSSGV